MENIKEALTNKPSITCNLIELHKIYWQNGGFAETDHSFMEKLTTEIKKKLFYNLKCKVVLN